MHSFLLAYLVTGAVFLALDLTWLSLMSGRLYRPALGALMRDAVALAPSIAFYLVYVGVLTLLAVAPAAAAGAPMRALVDGLLVGLIAYGAYNLTNAATLNGWPAIITLVDWTWGTLATGGAAWLAVRALNMLENQNG